MIRFIKETFYDAGTRHIEIACVSTDSKPTENVATGSLCLEVDTGKIYAYNETASAWVEVA